MTPRRVAALAFAALLTLSLVATPAAALFADDAEPDIQSFAAGPSYVVEFDNSSASELRQWVNDSADRQLIRLDEQTGTATVAAPEWQLTDSWLTQALAGQPFADGLAAAGYVESVHPNYLLERPEPVRSLQNASTFSPNQIGYFALDDPDYPTAGVAFEADADETPMADVNDHMGASNVSADTSGVSLGVVDTGANVAGDDSIFQGRISNQSKNFITNETVAESGDSVIVDDVGHGTFTAAQLAGNPPGSVHDAPAKNASLLVLKALNEDGGSTADVAAAIRYAADQDVDVLSLSLGATMSSEPVRNAIDDAHDNGVQAVFVAAGNSRWQRSPGVGSPADVPSTISVGATNGSGAADAWSASFSQYGGAQPSDGHYAPDDEQIDVVAPGMAIETRVATTGGSVANQTLSGTSMATPASASAFAAAYASNTTLQSMAHEDVHDAVASSARPAPHLAESEAGHGMFAADNLASGETLSDSQADSMTDAATQRQAYYEAASAAKGGWGAEVQDWLGAS